MTEEKRCMATNNVPFKVGDRVETLDTAIAETEWLPARMRGEVLRYYRQAGEVVVHFKIGMANSKRDAVGIYKETNLVKLDTEW